MGNTPTYRFREALYTTRPVNQLILSLVFVVAFVLFTLGVIAVSKNETIACGVQRTVLAVHAQQDGQTTIRQAVIKMGQNPGIVQNIDSASEQAHLGRVTPGTGVYVCLEKGEQRVAQINDIQITG